MTPRAVRTPPSDPGPAPDAPSVAPTDGLSLVMLYTGTVVNVVARSLALLAIETRPSPEDKVSELTKTVIRVTEGARLLCGIAPDQPFDFLTAEEQAKLRALMEHYTPPPDA